VPLLALQARDDPAFCDAVREIIPLEEMRRNPSIIYMETAKGGHFGYVQGA
jgi:predicted alpha/beta-fold hydrolase